MYLYLGSVPYFTPELYPNSNKLCPLNKSLESRDSGNYTISVEIVLLLSSSYISPNSYLMFGLYETFGSKTV